MKKKTLMTWLDWLRLHFYYFFFDVFSGPCWFYVKYVWYLMVNYASGSQFHCCSSLSLFTQHDSDTVFNYLSVGRSVYWCDVKALLPYCFLKEWWEFLAMFLKLTIIKIEACTLYTFFWLHAKFCSEIWWQGTPFLLRLH